MSLTPHEQSSRSWLKANPQDTVPLVANWLRLYITGVIPQRVGERVACSRRKHQQLQRPAQRRDAADKPIGPACRKIGRDRKSAAVGAGASVA